MFEYPVGARERTIETGGCAVAGGVDAVFVEEVDHRHNTRHIDSREVADAAAFVGWCAEVGETVLGDIALADGVLGIGVVGGEDVEVGVGGIVEVAGAEGTGEDGGEEEEGGDDCCG